MTKEENDPIYKMSRNDFYRITGQENKLKEDGEKEIGEFKESEIDRIISEKTDLNKYRIDKDKDTKIVQVFKKTTTKPLIHEDKDMNKFFYKDDEKRLKFYDLKLPSAYKDASLEEFQEALDTGLKELNNIRRSFTTNVKYETDSVTSLLKAKATAKKRPNPNTLSKIDEYNTLSKFNDNMRKLKEYKEKTGTGIIHFNNPHQLVDRLELLAGSIFAGNNGVKQEFSQIAHLLHQLEVITKKQLNDLLKKYILNK